MLKRLSALVQSTLFRSSRPDYIETRSGNVSEKDSRTLFRSSRPDYIETKISTGCRYRPACCIVPVFQAGLH